MQFFHSQKIICPLWAKRFAMRLLFFILVCLAVGCENQPKESRFEKIAIAFCECTRQLAALNEKTANIAADTNAQVAFQESLQQIQNEYVKAKECTAATIVSRYGKFNLAQLDSVKTALAGKCANLTEQSDLLQEMLGE